MTNLKDYQAYLKSNNLSQATIEGYTVDLNQLMTVHTCLNKVTKPQLLQYMVWLSERGLSASSINRKIASIQSYYKYLSEMEIIKVNPASDLKRRKMKTKVFNLPSLESIKNTIESCDNDSVRLAQKIMMSARRISEVCGLNVEDINFENGTMTVKTKVAETQTFAIPTNTLREIREYMDKYGIKSGVLLRNRDWNGFTTDTLRRHFKKLGYNPHTLRHSCATEMIRKGAPLSEVQAQLGHKTGTTTLMYAHSTITEQKNTLDKLGV
jgi:site-specific recombinase XerD